MYRALAIIVVFALAVLSLPNVARAQGYPSPTFQNLTVLGLCTGCGGGGSPVTWPANGDVVIANGNAPSGIAPVIGQCLLGIAGPQWGTGSCGTGTVTSVGILADPTLFTSGLPVTTSGTLTATLITQQPNTVFAGPSSGTSPAAPTFRSLISADMPTVLGQATTFTSGLVFSGLSASTQVACVGLDASNNVVLSGAGCGSGSGAVSSVTGTAGQISANPTTGPVVLSLPSLITENLQFSGTLAFSGLGTGTQTSCLGLTATSQVVPSGSACGAGGGGGNCTVSGGAQYQMLVNNGSSGCSSSPDASVLLGALTLGASGTVGSLTLGNDTSGTLLIEPALGVALGTITATLPANTGTVSELNLQQSWSANQNGVQNVAAFGQTFTPHGAGANNWEIDLGSVSPNTINNPDSTLPEGSNGVIYIVEPAAGNATIAWGGLYTGTSNVVINPAANAQSSIAYTVDPNGQIALSAPLPATAGNGQLLIGNGAGFNLANLVCGDGTICTSGVGSITLNGSPVGQSIGWIAGVNPNGANIVVDLPAAYEITQASFRPEALLGAAGTISVYIAPSGTACGSGTNIASNSFNANTGGATPQELTLTSSPVSVPQGDSVCLQTTGTWTGGGSIGTVTIYMNPV